MSVGEACSLLTLSLIERHSRARRAIELRALANGSVEMKYTSLGS